MPTAFTPEPVTATSILLLVQAKKASYAPSASVEFIVLRPQEVGHS